MAGNYTRINTERGQSEKPKSKKTEIQDPIYAQFPDAFHREAEQMDANFKCRKKRRLPEIQHANIPSHTLLRRPTEDKTRKRQELQML